MKTRKLKQLEFIIPQHGGARRGAGRKKILFGQPNHVKRPVVSRKTPLGITLKFLPHVRGLRTKTVIQAVTRAFERAREFGFKVIHFSLQSNHAHLVVEVESNKQLECGMKSVNVTLARYLQKASASGHAFRGRYHLHLLKTPREVRNAVKYILFNHAKHTKTAPGVDPFSSIYFFKELDLLLGDEQVRRLREELSRPPSWIAAMKRAVVAPASWLLRNGWRRASR